MKLYTEEQVRQSIVSAMLNYGMWLEQEKKLTVGKIVGNHIDIMDKQIANLTPIELPSNEEIYDKSNTINIEGLSWEVRLARDHFNDGAKWVIEKIKQQDNDK